MALNQYENRIESITLVIKNKRITQKLSQEYMAAKMRLSQNTYSKIELGNTRLTMERLLNICDILEIDYISLLDSSKNNSGRILTLYKPVDASLRRISNE